MPGHAHAPPSSRAWYQACLPPQIIALQQHAVEQLNAHIQFLLEGGSFSEELVAALRALDVGARPVFAVAPDGVFSDTALLLASSAKRLQDAAMKPCPALAGKRGAPWVAEVKARSIAFAHEVAGRVQPQLTAWDPLLSVAAEEDFVLRVALMAPSPLRPPTLVSLEHSWVQVIMCRVFAADAIFKFVDRYDCLAWDSSACLPTLEPSKRVQDAVPGKRA